MHRPVSLAVVGVFVAASLSISAVSETPERPISSLDENTQPEGEGKRLLRVSDDASDDSNEERVGPPIEMNPSVVSRGEINGPHAAIPNMPNEQYMALIRDHDVAKYFDTEIDISMVGTSLAQLRELATTSEVDNYRLILMAIGNELLKTRFPDDILKKHYRVLSGFKVMKRLMGVELYEKWKNLLSQSSFSLHAMFEMMRYLIGKTDLTLDLNAYGYMAMGRILLSSPNVTPVRVPTLPTLTHLEKMSMQRGVDPSETKLWLQWLKEKQQNSGKDEDELLLEALSRAMGDHLTLGQGT